ncbi:MAG: aminotransferase class V-fold PLP-dependent enzyme [Armatimonadota bacterium]|nr:aminotransferase class V-fold PLP-dependent enzyme [Armatimonadota bacterium]
MRRIYLDNSATSYPKPEAVYRALDHFMREVGASAGRGAYAEARWTEARIQECREAICQLIHAPKPERLIFTLNATDALNLAIRGVVKPGDHVVTSAMDHNSVLRPLNALQERGIITYTRVECSRTGEMDPDDLRRALRPNTRLIAMVHGSNVCGSLLPVVEVGKIARERGILCLIDAAQTCGAYPIDLSVWPVDLLAFPGHKGLLGPLGTGALYIGEGVELATVREGGTGSVSEKDTQPEMLPDRYEAGSHNAAGIVALLEGVRYLLDRGVEEVRAHKERLVARFLSRVTQIEGVTVRGPQQAERNAGVVSVTVEGLTPQQVANALDERYRVQTRPGLHCAPWAHRALGSYPAGTTRFSLGPFTTEEEIDTAAAALAEVAQGR